MLETTTSPTALEPLALPPLLPRLWAQHGRAILTLADQGMVSIASFATNFILLNQLAGDRTHYAYFVLAFNLMIWIAELHGTLVFTPHTIMSPRLSGQALRRFHGSTLLHHFAISLLAMIGIGIVAMLRESHDLRMSHVLLMLSAGAVAIGVRNYARPYCFTARLPMRAFLLDSSVCVLQVGGVLVLAHLGRLGAASAIGVIGAASAAPALVWLMLHRRRFSPSLRGAIDDVRNEWPRTRWVFLSGLVWNAGMQLYPWLIAVTVGTYEVAAWGACYQLAAIANPLLMGLQNFTGPRIAEAYTERGAAAFRGFVFRIAGWSSLLMIGPAVVLCIFADFALSRLTHGEFTGHQVAISFLCGAILLQATTFSLSRGLFALHRADLDLYCNFGPLLMLFTGGAWLTFHFGATGAAASMFGAQVLSSSTRAMAFVYATRRAAEAEAA